MRSRSASTVSPDSDRLFSGAIMQSGNCDGPWLIFDKADATSFGEAYATAVGCPQSKGSQPECLRSLTYDEITKPYVSWFNPDWPSKKTYEISDGKGRSVRTGIMPGGSRAEDWAANFSAVDRTGRSRFRPLRPHWRGRLLWTAPPVVCQTRPSI